MIMSETAHLVADNFFSRLNEILKRKKMTAAELSIELGKKPRFIEVCKRNKSIPDFDIVVDICHKLNVDVSYFTGQQRTSDNVSNMSDINFPSSYSNFANVLPREEFRSYLKNVSFPSKGLSISFYLSGTDKCSAFYSNFFFTEMLDILKKTETKNVQPVNITLYYPKVYTVEDILSDEYVLSDNSSKDSSTNTSICPDQNINNTICEFYERFISDYNLFRKSLFHQFDYNFLQNINMQIKYVDWESLNLKDNPESAIIANDFGYYTLMNKYIITTSANSSASESLNKIKESFCCSSKNNSKKEKKNTPNEQITTFVNLINDYKANKCTVDECLDELCKKGLADFLGNRFTLIGLSAVGKTTIMNRYNQRFISNNKNVERSDIYINERIFLNVTERDEFYLPNDAVLAQNEHLYYDIRRFADFIAIDKAIAVYKKNTTNKDACSSCLCDLGAKEVLYDDVFFYLLDNDFVLINLVIASEDKKFDNESDAERYYKEEYKKYISLNGDELIKYQKEERRNFYQAAYIGKENGHDILDYKTDKFQKFLDSVFDKRWKEYKKRASFTIYRNPAKQKPDELLLEVLIELIKYKAQNLFHIII